MAKNDLLLYGVLAVGAYIYYTQFGGKAQLDSILAELKGGIGGGTQINTGQNVSGNADAGHIQSQVQSMLQKMGVDMNVNNGSGQSISKTRQIDTTGAAKQTQTHSQKSTAMFTMPTKFGNL